MSEDRPIDMIKIHQVIQRMDYAELELVKKSVKQRVQKLRADVRSTLSIGDNVTVALDGKNRSGEVTKMGSRFIYVKMDDDSHVWKIDASFIVSEGDVDGQ